MRTYELHATFKQVKRADGRSSVAASAYRSGTRLVDERTGEVCDYTRKGGVEHSAIFAPADSPSWATDRSQLWNAAEQKENRSNSMTARELEVGFPSEFNAAQRREAGSLIAQRLVEKFGVAADIAYHEPGKVEGDHPNYHAHILFTSRALNKNGWEKNKYRDFNNDLAEVAGEKTTLGKVTVKEWRSWVADCFNQIAERNGLEVKTEHLSFEERGIDKLPTVKMGVAATQMERRGIQTDRGDYNRAVKKNNALAEELRRLNTLVPTLKRNMAAAGIKVDPRATPEMMKREHEKHLRSSETVEEANAKFKQANPDLFDKFEAARKAEQGKEDFRAKFAAYKKQKAEEKEAQEREAKAKRDKELQLRNTRSKDRGWDRG